MRRTTLARKLSGLTAWLLLMAVVIWSFFPILYIVMTSFKPALDVLSYPPTLPLRWSVENYVRLFQDWPQFWKSLANSAIVTVCATGLTILLSLPAAYAVSRYKSRKLGLFTFFIILIRMFPPIIITIPLFPLLRSLRLIDSHAVLIVLYAAFMVSLITLIMRSFIDEVPAEIEEAALIDGCGRASILVRIILPLTATSLAASAVITAVFTWNEFLFALIFTASKARTSPLMISEMLGSFLGVDWGVLFAATSLQLTPILFFTLKIQKHLVRGLTIGAVKG